MIIPRPSRSSSTWIQLSGSDGHRYRLPRMAAARQAAYAAMVCGRGASRSGRNAAKPAHAAGIA